METKKIVTKRTKTFKIIAVSIGAFILIRLILPFIILYFANKNLSTMKGYYGHIKDIDLSIIRGAYQIDSIYLNKLNNATHEQTSFFAANRIDLSIEWRAIFHGALVGELTFEKPLLVFVKNKVEPGELLKDSTDFKKLLKDFMPLKINRFEIKNGTIRYTDEDSKPPFDIEMTNTYLLAENLKNSYDSSRLLPATIKAEASVYEGTLDFEMKLNALAETPTFDMNTEFKNINLVKLNEFFQAYAKVDVNKGTFGLYVEVAAKEGKFKGYIKPLIEHLDILGKEDRDDTILRKVWEGLVGSTAQIFKNQSKDQIATKLPFDGDVGAPNTNLWYGIINILKNAFIKALQPAIDNEISIASVDVSKKENKTFLQKVFGKKKPLVKTKTN